MKEALNGLFLILILSFAVFTCHGVANNIYVNSIPKCGTHLVTRCIELMTGLKKFNTEGDLVTKDALPELAADVFPYFHVGYSEKASIVFEKKNYRCLFIYRDPRDEVVSYTYWRFVRYKWKDKMNFPAVMNELIDDVLQRYNAFLPWMTHPLYYSLRFEDLIGPQGGGNLEAQIREIKNIATHIGFSITDDVIENICKNIFGHGGGTFREGKIGSWKEHFTEAQKVRFKEKAGALLIQLGYEKDLNW